MKTCFFVILMSLVVAFASACSPVSISGTGDFIGRRAYYLIRSSDPCILSTNQQAGACAVLSKFTSSDAVGLLGNFTKYPGGGAVDGQLNCNGQYLLSEITNFARRGSAEHLIATKALRCTAMAWILIVAQCSAIP